MRIFKTLSRTLSRTSSKFGARIHENQTRCETKCETRGRLRARDVLRPFLDEGKLPPIAHTSSAANEGTGLSCCMVGFRHATGRHRKAKGQALACLLEVSTRPPWRSLGQRLISVPVLSMVPRHFAVA